MKSKRKTSLPRVTVLAYNRRDLVAFVQAVENLRLLVDDLRAEVVALKAAAVSSRRPTRSKPATHTPSLSVDPVPDGAELRKAVSP